MRQLLRPIIVANGVFDIVALAVQFAEWTSRTIATILLVAAVVWTLVTVVYWLRRTKVSPPETKPKRAVGGLIGATRGKVRVDNCHFEGKISVRGKPGQVHVGGLIGSAGEGTEVVDSSADAEIEYRQD